MKKHMRKIRARNPYAVDAHFRKAGAMETDRDKIPRKVKHKRRVCDDEED